MYWSIIYSTILLPLTIAQSSDPSQALWKPWLDLFTFGSADSILNLGKQQAPVINDAPPLFKPPPPPNFGESVSSVFRGSSNQALYDFDNFAGQNFAAKSVSKQGAKPRNFVSKGSRRSNGNRFNFNSNSNNNPFNFGSDSNNNNNNPFNLPQKQNFEVFGDNFGVPKGRDCIPYIGGVIKLLWKDCQEKAEALTWGQLGNQIQVALQGGKIDYTGALRETCKLQADRNFCEKLGKQVLECNIMGTLATTMEIQQAKERCDKVDNFFQTARSDNVLGNIGNLIGSEVGSALIRNFFQG